MGSVTVPLCSRTQNNPTLIARRGRSSVLIIRNRQLRESGFGDGLTVMFVNEATFNHVLRNGVSFRKQTSLLASMSAPHTERFAVLLNITNTNGKSLKYKPVLHENLQTHVPPFVPK